MLLRILRKSISKRKSRIAIAIISVITVADQNNYEMIEYVLHVLPHGF